MSGKIKLIVILTGAAVVSFGISMAATLLFGGGDVQEAQAQLAADQAQAIPAVNIEEQKPKEKMLNHLIRELRVCISDYRQKKRRLEEHEKRLLMTQRILEKQSRRLEMLRIELGKPLSLLKQASSDLDRKRIVVAKYEKANLQENATILGSMDPAESSKIIERMCGNGQYDDVVKTLRYMKQRSAGKLLAEMKSKALAATLLEKMTRIKEQG